MILDVINAEHKGAHKLLTTFSNGVTLEVDLEKTIWNDHRRIFAPLRELDYFKNFHLGLNTVTWPNGADFAPEFLLELGMKQENDHTICA